ncbi:MAG: GAF domain-containing protein [Planctomycetota bacterium]
MLNAPTIDPPAPQPPVHHGPAYLINWEFCHSARTLKLMRRFMADTALACRASESTFWVISADGKRIEGAVNAGPAHDQVEKLVVQANDSVVGLIATAGISLCVGPDEFMNPEIKKQFSVRNMVVAPVKVDAQICGVVSAINVKEGEKFKPEDLDALQWKAYLLGLLLSDVLKDNDDNFLL